MLDGASRIGEVVAAAAKDGQPALGITDHGNMYGVLDFYKEARAQGINPIIGTEAYMAYDSRFERPSRRGRVDDSGGEVEGGRKLYYHLTLLAENLTGYKNLIQLSSKAFLEGYYYKPRLDWELLSQHAEGVIATTGCLGGHVLQALMNESFDAALEKAGRLRGARKAFDALVHEWGDAPEAAEAQLGVAALHETAGNLEAAFREYQYFIEHYASGAEIGGLGYQPGDIAREQHAGSDGPLGSGFEVRQK